MWRIHMWMFVFFFKQKTAYEMRISDWSSDVCSSDLTSAPEPNHLRMFHNHVVVQASAYQNSCFVVATAKAGIEDGCMLIGGSCIVQPSGELVALASSLGDELVTYACDLDFARMGKETVFNFAKHRRDRKSTRLNSSH